MGEPDTDLYVESIMGALDLGYDDEDSKLWEKRAEEYTE